MEISRRITRLFVVAGFAACSILFSAQRAPAQSPPPPPPAWWKVPGQVLLVRSKGTVHRLSAASVRTPARSSLQLRNGERLELGAKATVELLCRADGTLCRLTGPAVVRIVANKFKVTGGSMTALPSVNVGLLRALGGAAGVGPMGGTITRGMAKPVTLLAPRYSVTNDAGGITLRWTHTASATPEIPATVQVREVATGAMLYTAEVPVGNDAVTVESSELQPGVIYRWTLTRNVDGVPDLDLSEGADFRILTESERKEIAQFEQIARNLRGRLGDDSVTPDLLLAAMYEKFGMMTEARAIYQSLGEKSPGDDEIKNMLSAFEKRLTGSPDKG